MAVDPVQCDAGQKHDSVAANLRRPWPRRGGIVLGHLFRSHAYRVGFLLSPCVCMLRSPYHGSGPRSHYHDVFDVRFVLSWFVWDFLDLTIQLDRICLLQMPVRLHHPTRITPRRSEAETD